MLLSKLVAALVRRELPISHTPIDDNHVHVQLLTDENQQVQLLPPNLANSLNLIADGAPLQHAIEQMEMVLEPSFIPLSNLDELADGASILYCKLSGTYAVIYQGKYSLYVDQNGQLYKCWSR